MDALLAHLGIDHKEFMPQEARSKDLPGLMCNGEIDAAIYSTGHPNNIYRAMIDGCDASLLELWDDQIAQFVNANPDYQPATIAGGTYRREPRDRRGFGLATVLSVRADLPDPHVREIRRVLQERREQLSEQVPAYADAKPASPLESPSAPLHSGLRQWPLEKND